MQWKLPVAGFLSTEIDEAIPYIVEANKILFDLAKDANHLVMSISQEIVTTVKTGSMEEEAVITRLLLRGTGFYQGGLLMAERGMHVESRSMARSVLEVTFAIGAMEKAKEKFMKMLHDDHLKSRRQRFQTVQDQYTNASPEIRESLKIAINKIEKSLELISPKKISYLGGLENAYLAYQVLSDNASHVSAKSLDHYCETFENRKFWNHKVGAGTAEEIGISLYYLLFSILPIIVGVADIMKLEKFSVEVSDIFNRFEALPEYYLI